MKKCSFVTLCFSLVIFDRKGNLEEDMWYILEKIRIILLVYNLFIRFIILTVKEYLWLLMMTKTIIDNIDSIIIYVYVLHF